MHPPLFQAGWAAFTVANAIWLAAVFVDGMSLPYIVADTACVLAAGALFWGARVQSTKWFGAGAVGSMVCQGPFYLEALDGGLSLVAQSAYVTSCVLAALAAWTVHRGGSGVRLLWASASFMTIAALLWASFTSGSWNLWLIGNYLAAGSMVPVFLAAKSIDSFPAAQPTR